MASANLLEHPGTDNEKDIYNLISPDLHRHFRPEFLNRLDDILPFLPLKKIDMGAIAEIRLNELRSRLVEKQISLDWEPGVLTYLADKGFDPAFGARPLKRLIQQDISNLIAKGILNGNIFWRLRTDASMPR